MNLCMADCREILYPYTKVDVEDAETRTDTLVAVEEYNIVMLVPDDFSKTTESLLELLIHEFVVASIMADWMSITNKPKEETWQKKAEKAARKAAKQAAASNS